jgi:broad specificity phosphatase PhoE
LGRDYDPNVIFSGSAKRPGNPGFSGGLCGDIIICMAYFTRYRGLVRAVFLAVGVLLPVLIAPPGARAADLGADLVQALRSGGYVIYFRHSATDWTQNDDVRKAGDWQSCDGARMRQLSDAGRDIARQVGNDMRALRIPVSEVISSEYCRSAETARLLGLGEVRTTTDIMNLRSQSYVGGMEAAVRNARGHFTRPPAPGTNRVIVGHGNLMRATTGDYAGEAGAGVYRAKPGSELGFVRIALIDPPDWRKLADEFGGGK